MTWPPKGRPCGWQATTAWAKSFGTPASCWDEHCGRVRVWVQEPCSDNDGATAMWPTTSDPRALTLPRRVTTVRTSNGRAESGGGGCKSVRNLGDHEPYKTKK